LVEDAFGAVPAVVAAVHPRVTIINNGETKGGDPNVPDVQLVPDLEITSASWLNQVERFVFARSRGQHIRMFYCG